MSLTLEEALTRVPQWAGMEDLATSFLAGGITNQNYKIETGGEAFVLRLVGANTELLGVNREAEYTANTMAGTIGIAPEVIHFIRPENCLVSRFIKANEIPQDVIRKTDTIQRIVALLKQIHAMEAIDHEFYAFDFVRSAASIVQEHGTELPGNFDSLLKRMAEIESALNLDRSDLRLCHNDLLNANFLEDGDGKIFILDWEYAGMNDPFFDLANFSTNHEFNDDHDKALLEAYFGGVTPADWAHLKLMRIMSDYREAMWAMIQIGISELDFDYRDYAQKHFDRLAGSLGDSRYAQWLKDVQAG